MCWQGGDEWYNDSERVYAYKAPRISEALRSTQGIDVGSIRRF